jgi:hypothetical protein
MFTPGIGGAGNPACDCVTPKVATIAAAIVNVVRTVALRIVDSSWLMSWFNCFRKKH